MHKLTKFRFGPGAIAAVCNALKLKRTAEQRAISGGLRGRIREVIDFWLLSVVKSGMTQSSLISAGCQTD